MEHIVAPSPWLPTPWMKSLRATKEDRVMSPILARYIKTLSPEQKPYVNWRFLFSAAGARWLLCREKKLQADAMRARSLHLTYIMSETKYTTLGLLQQDYHVKYVPVWRI
jgi:hypothetical protein